MPRALSRDTREIIIKLLQQGKYQRDIAEQLDVSRCAVQKAISTWKKSGALTPTYSAGCPRKTTQRDDRVIIQKCLSNPSTHRHSLLKFCFYTTDMTLMCLAKFDFAAMNTSYFFRGLNQGVNSRENVKFCTYYDIDWLKTDLIY